MKKKQNLRNPKQKSWLEQCMRCYSKEELQPMANLKKISGFTSKQCIFLKTLKKFGFKMKVRWLHESIGFTRLQNQYIFVEANFKNWIQGYHSNNKKFIIDESIQIPQIKCRYCCFRIVLAY